MKILKKILTVLIILVALPLLLALFVKKDYQVQRAITINRPSSEVYNYVKLLKNQDHYSKWVRMDPAMKKDFRGTDGTVGFVYAWEGNKDAGKGEQEIIALEEDKLVDVEVRFVEPFAGVAQAPIGLEALSPAQTRVTWGMEGSSDYPMNIMNLFIDNMLGRDIDSSLLMLKELLEK